MKYAALSLLIVFAALGCANDDARDAEAAMAQNNNHIDYVEFAAEDLAAFKAFYAAAFGWAFQDWGPDYVSFSGAGVEGGARGG
ncbi:MAG: hypothetical protein ACX939_13105, partial [Hyphococcus sp.]